MESRKFDLAIIGGGIVGLATAKKAIEAYPRLKIVVLEKEKGVAIHQSGHNSGVIHAGLYYKPGSRKARMCISGRKALLKFCEKNDIPYAICGKVVVATREEEIPRLEELFRRGTANGVPGLELIDPEKLKDIEPHARGVMALHCPGTGIVDFSEIAKAYARVFCKLGGEVRTSTEVKNISKRDGEIIIETSAGEFSSKYLINCAGLFADRVAKMCDPKALGNDSEFRIIPFRGEYYELIPSRRFLVKGLVYPTPDPKFPFLGVHFTRTVHGGVEAGPNAVLAFAREGYRKRDVKLRDLLEIFSYKGFWFLAKRDWRAGCEEMYRSISKSSFTRALQELVPDVRPGDLVPAGSGVRAQAVSVKGVLADDFEIFQSGNSIHILNAPSPAATASLAIGEEIVAMAGKAFSLEA